MNARFDFATFLATYGTALAAAIMFCVFALAAPRRGGNPSPLPIPTKEQV